MKNLSNSRGDSTVRINIIKILFSSKNSLHNSSLELQIARFCASPDFLFWVVYTTCSYLEFFLKVRYSRLSAPQHYSLNVHVPSVQISSKVWKKQLRKHFQHRRDQPYKEGKQNPFASPGVKATTNLNFHNRSENSNYGEHLESRHQLFIIVK